MVPAANLPIRLGAYRVRGRVRIDRGAEVLLAREEGPLGFARNVTLRSVHRDVTSTTWGELELAREAQISELLEHPAIVRVLELFTENGCMLLAVDGWETLTLEELLAQRVERDGYLPDDACAYVIAEVASALAHAHTRGVIHRAVAPSIVVFDEGGSVRMSGFGVARVLEAKQDSAVDLLEARERVRSPEEAGGALPTRKSDVWALGALALQLFAKGDAASVAQRVVAFRPPRLSSLRRDLPREVCAAVDAALTIDHAQRTITCAELANWLGRVMDVDAGRHELGERIELRVEGPAEPAGARRLTRTIRRQTASRTRLRYARVREVLELDEVEEIEPEPASNPPIVVAPLPSRPPVALVKALPPALVGMPALRLPLVVAPAPPAPLVVAARAPRRVARAPRPTRMGSRMLLIATLACALAVVAHRAPKGQLLPRAEAAPTPVIDEPDLSGNACKPSDPHCAVDPPPPPVIAPPARKLPSEFGWAHIHSNGTVGQVFVAARAWGEPEKTIAVPCGRFYVNVARSDSKGGWHGWLNIGQTVSVPCDGSVAEITLSRPNQSYEVPSARSKIASTWRSTWPMSKQ